MELGRFSGFPGSGSANRVRDDFVKEINGARKVFLIPRLRVHKSSPGSGSTNRVRGDFCKGNQWS
jgi:hypothetical protein